MNLRPTDVVARAAALVAGLVLIAVGTAAVLWPTHVVLSATEHISTGPVVRHTTSTWWPWELAGAGTLLVLIGLVWLIAHVPIRKAQVLRVAGTTDPGFITVNLDGVASAAAAALGQDSNVQSAKGKAIAHGGTSTVELTVTVAHPAGLASVISAIDATLADVARATGGTGKPVAARAVVQIAKAKNSG
ncbi:hypothetical protein FZI85_03970 [Mycobacterium sp. CBMA293]|uniref:hypothetical protein n=1 Tax=unclassified Mycolicibacterium TaxID=2636767 RepID=UPI0012DCEB6F|nr:MULTISPECIES: hypothetical protein [unclassified Mycolicibacterium]MUL47092.1 hypothetical protein [Mycolicibacterium sp. CBMA 360]MUL58469.1 hypothetical protein [Mycolicibacterium sp. CBMA 335]MUL73927.1 hypothetical protein [Mycolicibacterium sp. CBMA 311]MUL93352.1 hypothetical protein [Mycolicibacterium sp. CBMA 230]MUM07899.1 hypothetical protein [Mycolicibacterium sp. CBMA 213]